MTIAEPDPVFRTDLALKIARMLNIHYSDETADTGTQVQTLSDNCPNMLPLSWSISGAPDPETFVLIQKTYADNKIVRPSLNPKDAAAAQEACADFFYKRLARRNTCGSQFNNSYRRIALKFRPGLLLMIIITGISACTAITPSQPTAAPTTTTDIFMPLSADQHAFEVVRATLSVNLGVDAVSITLVDEAPVD